MEEEEESPSTELDTPTPVAELLADPVFNQSLKEFTSAVPDISRWDKANLMTSRTVSVGVTDNVLNCLIKKIYSFVRDSIENV